MTETGATSDLPPDPLHWTLDLEGFSAPTPLVRRGLPAPDSPGVYVVECGESVAHIGTSSRLVRRLRTLAALGNHRGSAEVLCAAYCTGHAPTVRWRELTSADEARLMESAMKALGEPPQPRPAYDGCVNGLTLRAALVAAAGGSTWEAGYVEALFDVGEQLNRLFTPRFDHVWTQVGRPLGPWFQPD